MAGCGMAGCGSAGCLSEPASPLEAVRSGAPPPACGHRPGCAMIALMAVARGRRGLWQAGRAAGSGLRSARPVVVLSAVISLVVIT